MYPSTRYYGTPVLFFIIVSEWLGHMIFAQFYDIMGKIKIKLLILKSAYVVKKLDNWITILHAREFTEYYIRTNFT